MLKVTLLVIATLFIQVHSWTECADSECYFTETFENCGDMNGCMNGDQDFSGIMEYYNTAYRYNEAKKQDAVDLKLDVLYEKFNEKVQKGPRRCRYFKDYNVGSMCVTSYPSFYYYQTFIVEPVLMMDIIGTDDGTVSDENNVIHDKCNKFEQKLNTECSTARDNLASMSACNVTAEFEEKVVKLWQKCVNYVDI